MSLKKNVVTAKSANTLLRLLDKILYANAWPEDIATLSKNDRKQLSLEALHTLQKRLPNQPKIEFSDFNKEGTHPADHQGTSTLLCIVNDDMPFLIDSISNAIQSFGYDIGLILHPVLSCNRNKNGQLLSISPQDQTKTQESLVLFQLQATLSKESKRSLFDLIKKVLHQTHLATRDWKTMLGQVDVIIQSYRKQQPPIEQTELNQTIEFLQWLKDDNFIFLGVHQYRYNYNKSGKLDIRQINKGLGLLSDRSLLVLQRSGKTIEMTEDIQQFLSQADAIIVAKANVLSLVHRRVHLDYIGIKTYAADGSASGEYRFVGLFTSTAYTRSVRKIPLIQHKVDRVIQQAGFLPSSHSAKALVDVLENYPRDELFQLDNKRLFVNALELLQLNERPRVRIILRKDRFERFMSVLVYIPKDRYDTESGIKIGRLLEKKLDGWVARLTPEYIHGSLVRVYFIIGLHNSGQLDPSVVRATLEEHIDILTRSWQAQLVQEMERSEYSSQVIQCYKDAFPINYKNNYNIHEAIADIQVLTHLDSEQPISVRYLYNSSLDRLSLKILSRHKPLALSDRLPVLEHMGFRVISEQTFSIHPNSPSIYSEKSPNQTVVYVHDMALTAAMIQPTEKQARTGLLQELYMSVWNGTSDSDGLNALCLNAAIPTKHIILLRAMARYLLQTGIGFDLSFIAVTLNKYSNISQTLVDLFLNRFDPSLKEDKRKRDQRRYIKSIQSALHKVSSFDDDRIIHRFQNLILATLRTNFFQTNGYHLSRDLSHAMAIVFKFDPSLIEELPSPKPFRETFVFSPIVEGIHLRFGRIARGGLRWSDRAHDYRTEVLGLVKAQQVKNAVIVPVGAKGCFFPKLLNGRENEQDIQDEGIRAYKVFIGGLLDITDNIRSEKNIAPAATVCYDQPDPYLVVAADKGTSSFSDIANGLSLDRGFWLGDAFASGGSAGYDHKKMGITARGAWESVKRHFREMDKDIQTQSFTVIGVGDMSGDVFGNGMLLSPVIRLVAAFNHRDIFLDPDPDAQVSFVERKRIFDLPRSGWQDYDPACLSSGGGVFSRSEKSIPLSSKIRSLLKIHKKQASPNEIIKAILQLSVDLLWFGGIGTYVRASDESNQQVGDKTNDSIRLHAKQLHCKVIGEGANLAMTQRARIEFNQFGGHSYSDAIDNSGGVNSSDLEVNIKIALNAAIQSKKISRLKRNTILTSMTENVSQLCLQNNYRQGLAISLSGWRGRQETDFHEAVMADFERRGFLDRNLENLPSSGDIEKRKLAGTSLTHPEIAVLLSYSKIVLYQDIVDSPLPNDPWMKSLLQQYFPQKLQKSMPRSLTKHRLHKEIIATSLANFAINYAGQTALVQIQQYVDAPRYQVVKSLIVADTLFSIQSMFHQVDALDNIISGKLQLSLYSRLQEFLIEQALWFLRNTKEQQSIHDIVQRFSTRCLQLIDHLQKEKALQNNQPNLQAACTTLIQKNVPKNLAEKIVALPALATTLPVVLLAEKSKRGIALVAEVYDQLTVMLFIDGITGKITKLEPSDRFERTALTHAVEKIHQIHQILVFQLVKLPPSNQTAVEKWKEKPNVSSTSLQLDAIYRDSDLTLAKVSVYVHLLQKLADGK